MDLRTIVEEELNARSKCYGHCQDASTLKLLNEKRMMVGCYSCPSGYVSRIVAYGKEPDVSAFKTIVKAVVQGIVDVTDEDIRIATRYTWDLGIKQEPEGVVLKQVYWTQNYQRTKSDDPNREALPMHQLCIFLPSASSEQERALPSMYGGSKSERILGKPAMEREKSEIYSCRLRQMVSTLRSNNRRAS